MKIGKSKKRFIYFYYKKISESENYLIWITISTMNIIILGGNMKVIVHFDDEGPSIQDLIEELLLDCCSST